MKIENERLCLYFKTRAYGAILEKLENKRTGDVFTPAAGSEEFLISLKNKKRKQIFLPASAFQFSEKEGLTYTYQSDSFTMSVTVFYRIDAVNGCVKKSLEICCDDPEIILDYYDLGSYVIASGVSYFSAPPVKKRVYLPPYITTLGQPVYVDSFFMGLEFPTADNKVVQQRTKMRLYIGRPFSDFEGKLQTDEAVIGAAIGGTMEMQRDSFFAYLSTIARPARFRVQFNSWYDHMLDIDSEKIKTSFRQVADGFREAGYRNLDCYVVDDGWTDYQKTEFWAHDTQKFPNKFHDESALTKELGSTFGVWFGPRGGYTKQTWLYAKRLRELGYGVNTKSKDICTGDTNYIRDLTAKMAEFVKEYNVTYFKIDGFASQPCKDKRHGHPVGGYENMYFYTYMWQEWLRGFEKIRAVKDDVYLNVTSYAHCSPWFLKWCDAIWINNSGDMGYAGSGTDLEQCLNYRDGRYHDFFEVRQLQFPVSCIYNHEPCYAERNYNPPLPNPKHKTVVYTDEEFRQYLTMCMMRGTGFVELYLSPHMMSAPKWKIAAEVLTWAEKNFEIIKNNSFFGGVPEHKELYGYYGKDGKNALMIVRNPSGSRKTFEFDHEAHSFLKGEYTIKEIYPEQGEGGSVQVKDRLYPIPLDVGAVRLFEIKMD